MPIQNERARVSCDVCIAANCKEFRNELGRHIIGIDGTIIVSPQQILACLKLKEEWREFRNEPLVLFELDNEGKVIKNPEYILGPGTRAEQEEIKDLDYEAYDWWLKGYTKWLAICHELAAEAEMND